MSMDTIKAAEILGLEPDQLSDKEAIQKSYYRIQMCIAKKAISGEPLTYDEENIEAAYRYLTQEKSLATVDKNPLAPTPMVQENQMVGYQSTIYVPLSGIFSGSRRAVIIKCPLCMHQIPKGLLICPVCSNQIARNCPNCGDWNLITTQLCSRCAQPIQAKVAQNYYQAEAQVRSIQESRQTIALNKQAIDKDNERFVFKSWVIWLLIVALLTVIVLIIINIY